MNLEYIEDPGAEAQKVLLLWGPSESEIRTVRSEIVSLADGGVGSELQLERLPGISGIAGCALIARVGESDGGVERLQGNRQTFACELTPASWRRVVDLLQPFQVANDGGRFQYLTETGSIEWIISTDRSW
jgi:hypothetical protein